MTMTPEKLRIDLESAFFPIIITTNQGDQMH